MLKIYPALFLREISGNGYTVLFVGECVDVYHTVG